MRTLFDLDGKVALVTGGNNGIGLGMARALAAFGAHVVIWGTSAEKNAGAAAALVAAGGKVMTQAVDVADETAVDAAMSEIVETLGHVDAVFANAGIAGSPHLPFDQMSTETYRQVLGVNLDGVVFTLRAACRHMVTRGQGGSLVAVSSAGAYRPSPTTEPYVATKAALAGLMKTLAVEYATRGIRANTLVPGHVGAGMNVGRVADPEVSARVLDRVPVGRWGTADDFAGITVYLASDASRFHTGDTLVLDGAFTSG